MLRETLSTALKSAVKGQDKCATSTLRLILAALKDRDIAARSRGNADGIGDDEILQMLQTMVKQRRESIEMYDKGNRPELAERERDEIVVIEQYLPKQLDEREVGDAVTEAIAETGAETLKDMGGVMAFLRQRYAGRMDFGRASGAVKQRLAQVQG
ncbi:MAG: GatB/YqeY domain-containing protein [Alphaproteobacteria bacterium]|nr:GatB/YqeY domain-containing protein [Alphaproteobacteria bacterium]